MGNLDQRQKQIFYSNCHGLSAREIMDRVTVARSLGMEQKQVSGWLQNGQYLPLAVWAKSGYDIQAIEENARPEDRRSSKQFKWEEFRVPVYSDHHGGETAVTDTMRLGPKQKKTRALMDLATPAPLEDLYPGASDSGSGFSCSADEPESESSSSPPSPRPRKGASRKQKKYKVKKEATQEKKQTKEELAAAKKAEKEVAAKKKAEKKAAESQLKKVR